jgi:hypothetical protein
MKKENIYFHVRGSAPSRSGSGLTSTARRRRTMSERILRTINCGIMILAIFAIAAAAVSAQNEPPQRSLAGVWEVTTTPRNCTTGVPLPAAAFQAIYMFHKDGTLVSWYSQGTPAPGQGLWRREPGWSDYSFKLRRLLRTTTSPPVFAGTQELGGTIRLSESGDEYTSEEYMIVYGLDGVPSTPSCINSVGRRLSF